MSLTLNSLRWNALTPTRSQRLVVKPLHHFPPSVPIRVIHGCFRFLLLAAVAAPASALEIARVYSDWRDAASFKRISEYFTGRENTGGHLVLRTHPEERAGYYFLVRLHAVPAVSELQARLIVIRPAAPEGRTYTFPIRLTGETSVLNLGLTGPDWPDKEADAVAWKLDLLSADGTQVLATEKSYLWDKPAPDGK